VLRPSARSVDASVLLARALTPEPMRPGWPARLAMAHSALPYDRLLSIGERLRHAAARPVIVPDTIVVDHGAVFVSGNFRSSCRHLGISIQPAHLATGSDKPRIEKMFSTLGTQFCQFAAGYLGRSAGRRGRHVKEQPLWSLMQMQDLLDEWLIALAEQGTRRAPGPAAPAADVLAEPEVRRADRDGRLRAGPAQRRGPHRAAARDMAGSHGIKISHRTYDAAELNPIRQQKSGVTARKGLWEVRHDPYDVSRVFVRGPGGWITCPWKYLGKVPFPFGELAWDHVSGRLAGQGRGAASELERAQAVDDLLRRACHGPPDDPGTSAAGTARPQRRPSARDRRVAVRTRAATAAGSRTPAGPVPPAAVDAPETPQQDSGEPVAKVIPLGIFNAHEEAKKRW
jgi:putative transposase